MPNHMINEIGNIYGKWKVLRLGKTSTKGGKYWTCVCQCGNINDVRGSALRSGKSKCCAKCKHSFENLEGLTFGDWTVVKRINNKKVLVRCKCGNEKEVCIVSLKCGNTKRCNECNKKTIEEAAIKKVIGKKFNMLTVEEFAFKRKRQYFYKCKCECGGETTVNIAYLKNGDVKSCGCLISLLEKEIIKWLNENNKEYKTQVVLPITLKTGGNPIVDFKIKINDEWCFIEAQGEQHYKDTGEFGKYQREITDNIKRVWCSTHGIRLFEIRYDQNVNEELTKIFAHDNTVPNVEKSTKV